MISITYIGLLVVLCLFVVICLLLFVLIAPSKKYYLKYFHTYDGNLENGKYQELVGNMDIPTLLINMMQKNKLKKIDDHNLKYKYILLEIKEIKEIKGGNDEQQKK